MCSFGEKLKICRQALGLSQDQLALILNTTKQVVSHYERGDRTPKIDMAARYATALDVPVEYLTSDHVSFRYWEHDDYLEDYWNATPSQRLHLVVIRGLDPRVANDYKRIYAIRDFVRTQNSSYTIEEQDLIDQFRQLNTDGRSKFKSYLEDLLGNEKNLSSATTTAEEHKEKTFGESAV